MSNHTCPSEVIRQDPVPFYSHGSLNFKAHDVGWIICGFFTMIASAASFWLIWKHLTYYTCPSQQRHIVRMLFMVPIYAFVSLLSYVFYHEAVYYQTIRDCYEAVVITSFFYLLLQYVGDTPAEQHEVFRAVKLKKWFWPLGYWKYRPTGLHFLWLMKCCILQYAIVRPVCTLVAVGLQYFQLYCLESWAPHFGHIYITLAISISVTVAMYCVIQFYMPIQKELKPYSPVLKFLAVKSVVFLTFWQDSFLSLLVYFGAIKQSEYMSAADIQVGINALLETFEMCIFAFLHIKAFTYVIYRPANHGRTTQRWRAFLDVLDYRDWWYQMRQTSRYVVSRNTYTIADDIRREKYSHLEKALGRERWSELQRERETVKGEMPTFWRPGCEPTEEEGLDDRPSKEEQLLIEEKGEGDDKPPRSRNRAFDPSYDPERESISDRALDEDVELEAREKDQETYALLPTLPNIDFDPVMEEALGSRCPTTVAASTPGGVNLASACTDEDSSFVPQKGTRAPKEGSDGFSGAFWRAYRRGKSGSQGGAAAVAGTEEARTMLPAPSQLSGVIAGEAGNAAQRMLSGPRGRPIALVLPKPLSGDRVPTLNTALPQPSLPPTSDRNDMQHMQSQPRSNSTAAHRPTAPESSSRSSQSRLRFAEVRPPARNPRDDPEADLPSFNGYVVAGGQSLRQVREQERLREERRKESKRMRHEAQSQRHRRHSYVQTPQTSSHDRYTAQAHPGSILQRHANQMIGSGSVPHGQHPHRTRMPPQPRPAAPPFEHREGFHFEYVDD